MLEASSNWSHRESLEPNFASLIRSEQTSATVATLFPCSVYLSVFKKVFEVI